MPHKANAARRHHIPRPKRRVTNWSEYNEALRQRGSLTVWFTDEAITAWKAAPRTTPGGQPHYSDLAITTALTLRAVFHLALRQTEGLIGSILQLLGLDLPVPSFSTLSRRAYREQSQTPLFKIRLFLRRYSATYSLLRDIKNRFDIATAATTLSSTATHDYRPFWPAYLERLDALAALLQEQHIPLLFILIPESDHPIAPDWRAQNAAAADSLVQQLRTAEREQGNHLLESNALLPLLRQALTQRGIAYVDLLEQFARLPSNVDPQTFYLCPQDHHLSARGHLFAAETIAAYLHRHPLAAP